MSETQLVFDVEREITKLAKDRLLRMEQAGESVLESYRVLKRAEQNVVGQCLAHQGKFYELDHYPTGDIYDKQTHSQYYYHAHRPETGEHGHFHTFLRVKGMPPDIQPAPYAGSASRPLGKDAITHFIAISMNQPGFPIGLFTVNRWVAEETFYSAPDVVRMLDLFEVDHTYPCLATNRWVTSMLRLFYPQIKALVLARDETLRRWAKANPDTDIYEDRQLEVTSSLDIDVDRQIEAVRQALGREKLSA